MKICTRWLLALLLIATPMLAAVQFASANTELVPASRLVAPLYDISTGRSTFFLLTNVSSVELQSTAISSSIGAVHVEFYDKACARNSIVVNLSNHDIDQLNVVAGLLPTGSTRGFADIDVRSNPANTADSTSIQENALLGTVVITDTVADFALAYPMASSLGSAGGGAGFPIVTRGGDARALVWSGRYEAFPNRLFVPGFYAEGGTGAGSISSTILSVVSPADGFWYGGLSDFGESPGAPLAGPAGGATAMVNATGVLLWDGCEHSTNKTLTGHTVIDSLGTLFGTSANRTTFPWAASSGTCGAVFAQNDELSNVPVGWIDIPNSSCIRSQNSSFAGAIFGAVSTCVGDAIAPTSSAAKVRGMVGVLFENTNVAGGASALAGDVSRLWGDFRTITRQGGCLDSGGGSENCTYSFTAGSSTGTFALGGNDVTLP